jgi:hypothetical protein
MRRADLVFTAILVLDEALEAARAGRVAPRPGLRLALAYLYLVGDRRTEWFDREPYFEFWQQATQSDAAGVGAEGSAASWGRQTQMTAAMNAIARAAGLELDAPVLERIARARRLRPPAPGA